MTYALVRIEPEQVQRVWPLASDLIKRAMRKLNIGDFGVVEHELFNGDALLWIAWNGDAVKGAAVTQIGKANGERYCTIVGCAGYDGKEWIPLIAGLEFYARQEHCRAMRIMGRRGWKRVLPDYHVTGYVLERTLQ